MILSSLFLLLTLINPETEVIKTVNAVFEAMRSADEQAILDHFLPEATLIVVKNDKEGGLSAPRSVQEFADAVGNQDNQKWDEQIYDTVVKIDGKIADVWAPYTFYLNGNFSHCGVNQMTLVETASGWKIASIIYTRRTEDCLREEAKN